MIFVKQSSRANRWAIICLLSVLLCLAGHGFADEPGPGNDQESLLNQAASFFREANELLGKDPDAARELYKKSLRRFEKLAGDGISNGKLFYNIGNVYFRLDDLGRAILNYRRAELFMPGDENLRQNLSYVLGQRQDVIEKKPQEQVLTTLFFWHYDLPAAQRFTLFSIFYSVAWSLLCLRLFMKQRVIPHWGIFVSFLLAVFLAGSLVIDRLKAAHHDPGVITAREVVARKGDGMSYEPSFNNPLHAGTEFELVAHRGAWLHAELADGRRCWLPGDSAEFVGIQGK